MSFIGFNPNVPASVDGCGGGATAPMPRPRFNPDGTAFNGFELPALSEAPDPFGGERFVSSQGGGFIVGKDGELAGRVPANSYVDTKTGTVYGPDDKKIEIPDGANVDFRDLPDLKTILEMVKASAEGGGDGEITGERFVPSEAGGLIIGKDGNVAGRIPAGSFVDVKDGKVYGPDSKPITLPEGATVDFFDLPSIDELKTQARGGGAAAKGAKIHPEWNYAFPQTAVDGQWGPGGVTSFKGGKGSQVGGMHGAGEDCGMDHGGPSSTKAGGSNVASLQNQLSQNLAQLQAMGVGPFSGAAFPGAGAFHPILGGGPGSAVGGARGLGSLPSLDASLRELVFTLRELTTALAKTTGGGNSTTQSGTQTSTQSTPTTDSSPTTTSSSTTTTTSSGSGSSSSGSSSSSSSSSTST